MATRALEGTPDGNGILTGVVLGSDSTTDGLTVSELDIARLPKIIPSVSGEYIITSTVSLRILDDYGHIVAEIGSPDVENGITGFVVSITPLQGDWTVSGPTPTT